MVKATDHAIQGFFNRENAVLDIARGKKVLHLGCIGGSNLALSDRIANAEQSLHRKLTNIADVTGVDISADVVEWYRSHGIFSNVLVGDAEHLELVELPSPFDVIVAGDIIEHLANPGLMLSGVRALCHRDSILVITTPHAFGLMNFVRHALHQFEDGKEHVMTFNSQNIVQLVERYFFDVDKVATCYEQQSIARYGPFFKPGQYLFRMFPAFGGTLLLTAHAS